MFVFPSTDIRLKKPSDLSSLGEDNLQTQEPLRLNQPKRHKDLQSSSQHPLSKAGVAAPTGPVDISSPPLGTTTLTSTVEIVQNIIDQLLVKIGEGSNITADSNEVSKQKTSNQTEIDYIGKDGINKDLKISNANEEMKMWKTEIRKKTYKLADISVKRKPPLKQYNCLPLSNRFKCFEDEDVLDDNEAKDKDDCCGKSTQSTLELSSSSVVTEKEINLNYSEVTCQNNLAIVHRIIDLMSLSAVYSTDTKLNSKLDFSDDQFNNAKALRCSSCMISHFPCFKFCCWSIRRNEAKKNKHTKTINFTSDETIGLVQQRIKVLEEFEILNEKLKKLLSETVVPVNIKLRGGGKPVQPKGLSGFDSDSNVVNTVCNILRSLQNLWPLFDQHKLCSHSDKTLTGYSCIFCLARSLVYRSSYGKKN